MVLAKFSRAAVYVIDFTWTGYCPVPPKSNKIPVWSDLRLSCVEWVVSQKLGRRKKRRRLPRSKGCRPLVLPQFTRMSWTAPALGRFGAQAGSAYALSRNRNSQLAAADFILVEWPT